MNLATIETRTTWGIQAPRPEADGAYSGESRRTPVVDAGNANDEPRWPAWKVTVAVVIFCGAFWMGVGYVAMRLLG